MRRIPRRVLRVLIIEDNREREEQLLAWLGGEGRVLDGRRQLPDRPAETREDQRNPPGGPGPRPLTEQHKQRRGEGRRPAESAAEEVRAVVATSAGVAIGILQRDRGRVYSGIVLDHDLQGRRRADSDERLSGNDVVEAIVRHVDREVPILIHSAHLQGSLSMARALDGAGFEVTRIPMDRLDEASFGRWMEEVRECFRSADAE